MLRYMKDGTELQLVARRACYWNGTIQVVGVGVGVFDGIKQLCTTLRSLVGSHLRPCCCHEGCQNALFIDIMLFVVVICCGKVRRYLTVLLLLIFLLMALSKFGLSSNELSLSILLRDHPVS